MSRFTSHLGLRLLETDDGRPVTKGGRCLWETVGDLAYEVGREGSGETIYVPSGSVTDLASVPRIAWTLLPPDGAWLKAAVLHDALYRAGGDVPRLGHPAPYTRAEADRVFREAMKVLGVSKLKRRAIYAAVRIGGGAGWNA